MYMCSCAVVWWGCRVEGVVGSGWRAWLGMDGRVVG